MVFLPHLLSGSRRIILGTDPISWAVEKGAGRLIPQKLPELNLGWLVTSFNLEVTKPLPIVGSSAPRPTPPRASSEPMEDKEGRENLLIERKEILLAIYINSSVVLVFA